MVKLLKFICIGLGITHAIIMTLFATGPELAPLMVWIVDFPIAHYTIEGEPKILAYGVPILVCSIVYPAIIYLIGRTMIRVFRKTPQQDIPND